MGTNLLEKIQKSVLHANKELDLLWSISSTRLKKIRPTVGVGVVVKRRYRD